MRKHPEDILDGLRNGRIFVTTGDIISDLSVTVSVVGDAPQSADIGGTLVAPRGSDVDVEIRFSPAAKPNGGGKIPAVDYVDLIVGQVVGTPDAK